MEAVVARRHIGLLFLCSTILWYIRLRASRRQKSQAGTAIRLPQTLLPCIPAMPCSCDVHGIHTGRRTASAYTFSLCSQQLFAVPGTAQNRSPVALILLMSAPDGSHVLLIARVVPVSLWKTRRLQHILLTPQISHALQVFISLLDLALQSLFPATWHFFLSAHGQPLSSGVLASHATVSLAKSASRNWSNTGRKCRTFINTACLCTST